MSQGQAHEPGFAKQTMGMLLTEPSNIRYIEGSRYVSRVEASGTVHQERSDALRWERDRDEVNARYGYAIHHLRKARAKTVLDAASGLGDGTRLLALAGFDASGVEISPDGVAVARARYPWIRFDQADILSYEHEPVDGIVAAEILEHVQDGRAFLRQMNRMLKPNGVLIITTPNRKYSKGKNIFHLHEYTVAELRALLPEVPIRAFVTTLFRKTLRAVFDNNEDRYWRVNLRLSRMFPFHQLPDFAQYVCMCVKKADLRRALAGN
jgi:2-polyprenyl-3-methyl-5-hydroxy-6-metoxy-1,4-benzoquinol methylase